MNIFLRAYSHNLSWATQLNVENGSEAKFVSYCQFFYPDLKRAGLLELPLLSKCTHTAIDDIRFLQGPFPHLLCFQELASKAHAELIGKKVCALAAEMGSKHKKRKTDPSQYRFVVSSSNMIKSNTDVQITLLTVYDSELFVEPPEVVAFKDFGEGLGRPIQVLFFRKLRVAVVNCHWPQPKEKDCLQNDEKRFVSILEECLNDIRPVLRRILILGDFNRSQVRFSLFDSTFFVDSLGLRLKLKPASCCCYQLKQGEDQRPETVDLILDTYNAHLRFEVFLLYGDNHAVECDLNPKSDHHPVYADLPPVSV